jgi:hypothetical protein
MEVYSGRGERCRRGTRATQASPPFPSSTPAPTGNGVPRLVQKKPTCGGVVEQGRRGGAELDDYVFWWFQALVCQSSAVTSSGSQPGRGIRRYFAMAMTYGSYCSRRLARLCSAFSLSCSCIPISASVSFIRRKSSWGRRLMRDLSGEIEKVWPRSIAA